MRSLGNGAALATLVHRLTLRRALRIAPSRVVEILGQNLLASDNDERALRSAASALTTLGLPSNAVRLSLAQAQDLAPTIALVPGATLDAAAQIVLLQRRRRRWFAEQADGTSRRLTDEDIEISAIDLRSQPATSNPAKWLWNSVRQESRYVIAALCTMLMGQSLGLLTPLAAWLITDRALPDGASQLLIVAVSGLAVVTLHAAALNWWSDRVSRSLDQRLRTGAEGMMFGALVRTPYAACKQRTVGDAMQTLTSAETLAGSIVAIGLGPLLGLISAAIAWIALWMVLPGVALALAMAAVVLIVVSLPLARANSHWQGKVLTARGSQQSMLLELLNGVAALRVAGAEHAGSRRWLRRLVDEQSATLGQVRNGLWLDVLLEGSMHLSRAGWLAWGATACVRGDLSLGAFLAGGMLTEQVMQQVVGVAHAIVGLTALAPHWQRVRDALAATTQPAEESTRQGRVSESAVTIAPDEPALRLTRIGFRYDPVGQWVIHDYTLNVPVNALTMLDGASGAGKTTLLRIAAGLLTPAQGEVELFGRPVQPGDPRVGYLPQDAPLFEGSIASNLNRIANCPGGHLLHVARRAGLDDWVRTLPMGYATRVPAGGGSFSGGQRQLIALTGALASDRTVLLLDEPMSQLDRLARQHLLESGLFEDRTVVIVSHDRNDVASKGDDPYPISRDGMPVSDTYTVAV